jgi:glutaredoxin
MPATLHTCPLTWLRIPTHYCHRAERALHDAGVDYVRVTHPLLRGRRDALRRATGQSLLPVLVTEGGERFAPAREIIAAARDGRLA